MKKNEQKKTIKKSDMAIDIAVVVVVNLRHWIASNFKTELKNQKWTNKRKGLVFEFKMNEH